MATYKPWYEGRECYEDKLSKNNVLYLTYTYEDRDKKNIKNKNNIDT